MVSFVRPLPNGSGIDVDLHALWKSVLELEGLGFIGIFSKVTLRWLLVGLQDPFVPRCTWIKSKGSTILWLVLAFRFLGSLVLPIHMLMIWHVRECLYLRNLLISFFNLLGVM